MNKMRVKNKGVVVRIKSEIDYLRYGAHYHPQFSLLLFLLSLLYRCAIVYVLILLWLKMSLCVYITRHF